MNAITLGVLVYVALQLVVAFVVSRRITSEEDYLVAGRSLGFGMAMFTVFATWFGAETCVGATAKAFEGGLAETNADPFGYAICLLVMGLVFAVPFYRSGITTLADLFRRRWGGGVEKLAALLLVPSSILWAAAQIRAFGIVLGASSSIPIDVMIVIAGAVVIVYTATGGLWADAVTDLIQGGVLIVALVVLAVNVFATGGEPGLASITADQLALFDPGKPLLATLEGWAVPIFGSLVAQELVARVMAARSPTIARRAVLSASALYFVVGIIPPVIGLVAVHALPAGTDGEQALALMAQRHLPAVLYVVFAGALVSAILSTVDSALLAAGALLAHNVILPAYPRATERTKLRVNRAVVVVFGVIACALALSAEGVYELVETASSLGTSGVLWVVIFGLWSTRFGGRAAAAACLLGGVTTYALATIVLELDYPFVVSLGASLALYLAVAAVEPRAR